LTATIARGSSPSMRESPPGRPGGCGRRQISPMQSCTISFSGKLPGEWTPPEAALCTGVECTEADIQ
jgi:hypothetical protein